MISEEFLHYIWKYKLFNQFELTTTNHQAVEIQKVGAHNSDAGPDFFNAKLKVGDTLWAGNVEVHINASDWKKHHHHDDNAYDNIILHVLYDADEKIYRKSGEEIPTLELKNRIDKSVLENYSQFVKSKDWIPCEKQVNEVPPHILKITFDKLLLERLETKSKAITNSLSINQWNWEATFYEQMARNFGFKTNAEPFELLAKATPLLVLAKHKSSAFQVEALLFGQAGFLNQHYQDAYANKLQSEYVFLKQKFKLTSIDPHLWKFLRLRPMNFPTIRIAQFAHLIFKSNHLFSVIMETDTYADLKKNLSIEASEYWHTHYVFDKESKRSSKHLGHAAIHTIIINTIVPFIFIYGKQKNSEVHVERAIKFLEQTEKENNAIISKWQSIGIAAESAFDTQALLQLKNEYCTPKKCLNCSIGNYLLKKQ